MDLSSNKPINATCEDARALWAAFGVEGEVMGSDVTDDNHNPFVWDVALTDRETFLIGKIVAQWGALEHEIFVQTLTTFDPPDDDEVALPKAMNNWQFTEVLSQWKARVADTADEERATVLQQQFDEILKLKDHRDALVHGMWEWSAGELQKVSTVRIRKKEILRTHFTADDLEDFYFRLAGINFKIRCPGGIQELAERRAKIGFYASRRFLSQITGSRVAGDWLSSTSDSSDEGGG